MAKLMADQLKEIVRKVLSPRLEKKDKADLEWLANKAAEKADKFVSLDRNNQRELFFAMASEEGQAWLRSEGFYLELSEGAMVIWFDHAQAGSPPPVVEQPAPEPEVIPEPVEEPVSPQPEPIEEPVLEPIEEPAPEAPIDAPSDDLAVDEPAPEAPVDEPVSEPSDIPENSPVTPDLSEDADLGMGTHPNAEVPEVVPAEPQSKKAKKRK